MQWLIDIVKEWIQAQGYLTTAYVDRGDPITNDFTRDDFPVKDAWTELDLSAIVPAGAKAVVFSAVFKTAEIGWALYFRKHGNVNFCAFHALVTTITGVDEAFCLTVSVDADRKVDYYRYGEPAIELAICITGWIL